MTRSQINHGICARGDPCSVLPVHTLGVLFSLICLEIPQEINWCHHCLILLDMEIQGADIAHTKWQVGTFLFNQQEDLVPTPRTPHHKQGLLLASLTASTGPRSMTLEGLRSQILTSVTAWSGRKALRLWRHVNF